jgi:hypothetical protein
MAARHPTGRPTRPAGSKQKCRTTSSSRGRSAPKRPDLQERAFQVFAEQADPLWTDLTDQCRQFAEGFNRALGGRELHVQAAPTTLRVTYPRADAELLVELDKAERYVQATLNTGGVTDGSCPACQPAVGLTVNGDELQFVLSGEVISNERLAVALLTQLTSAQSEQE